MRLDVGLPEDALYVVLVVVGVSPGHCYGVTLESVVLEVGGDRVLGTVISWWRFAGGKVRRYRWHG